MRYSYRHAFTMLSFIFSVVLISLTGCKYGKTRDTILSSVPNSTHTYRATVLRREYLLDNGMTDASPTTYVLLDADKGPPTYAPNQRFNAANVVMRPSLCGPLRLEWMSDLVLRIICDKCGLALPRHLDKVGSVSIVYEGFPDTSFYQ
jgi:hypothetical protein